MNKRYKRLVTSGLLFAITLASSSICITFAWYTSLLSRQAGGSSIKIENLEGTLYWYKKNKGSFVPNPNGDGSIQNPYGSGFTGYDGKIQQTLTGTTTLEILQNNFIEYDVSNPLNPTQNYNPFQMVNLLPETKHTFVFKLKSNHANPITARFMLDKWTSTCITANKYKFVNGNKKSISFAEATYIYTLDPAAGLWTESTFASNIQNFINDDTLPNRFNDETLKEEKLKNVPNAKSIFNENVSAYELASYSGLTHGVDYYLPFTIEFSNDQNTYYSPIALPQGEQQNGPNGLENRFYEKTITGNSNAYQGMNLTFNQISVCQYDPKVKK